MIPIAGYPFFWPGLASQFIAFNVHFRSEHIIITISSTFNSISGVNPRRCRVAKLTELEMIISISLTAAATYTYIYHASKMLSEYAETEQRIQRGKMAKVYNKYFCSWLLYVCGEKDIRCNLIMSSVSLNE